MWDLNWCYKSKLKIYYDVKNILNLANTMTQHMEMRQFPVQETIVI